MLKKHKRIKYILIILGLVIIPLYSIFFGANGDLFDMTFSQVGGRFDGKLESLIVWGGICSIYFYIMIDYMQMMIQKDNKLVTLLVGLGCICLMITVFLPFNTMMYPVSSEIHNKLVRVAVFIIIIAVLLFVINLKDLNKKTFLSSLVIYLICILALVIIFLKFHVSSIFQIAFVTVMSYFLMLEFILIEKCPNTNLLKAISEKEAEIKKTNPSSALHEESEAVFDEK